MRFKDSDRCSSIIRGQRGRGAYRKYQLIEKNNRKRGIREKVDKRGGGRKRRI